MISLKIIEVVDYTYHQFITDSQIKMASETENYRLDPKVVALGVSKVIDDPTKGTYYICLRGETPVSCLLTLTEWSDWRCQNVLWIHSVYVLEQYRQKGIYKFMYQHLKELVINSNHYAGLRLYVDKSNQKAIEVYHKLGMQSDHYALCEWMK